MKHHSHNPKFKFLKQPVEFNKNTKKELLQYCLGGVLYTPATKNILHKIVDKNPPATSIVMCFEDAISESDLPAAEKNVFHHLTQLAQEKEKETLSENDIPLIFLRVRNQNQFENFSAKLTKSQAAVLSGFVFPKFSSKNAAYYLDHLMELNRKYHHVLYGMPILEGKEIAYLETRYSELLNIKTQIEPYRSKILNIRVGATDFSSLFGVRRDINTSIYNIMPVRDCLSDILNFFNRQDHEYTVSAPVWEYFLAYNEEDINDLVFENYRQSLMKRNVIINAAIDGLIREIIMDRSNGFIGKTIIHPSHLHFVNGMQAVTREEYEDAAQIMEASGGVLKSSKANKMNEINPHKSWAKRIVMRATAYGVIEDDSRYLQLILGGS